MIRKNGFIDLNKMLKDKGVDTTSIKTITDSPLVKSLYSLDEPNIVLEINNDDEILYFKYNRNTFPYSELVANELAIDFGLPIVEYDLAILKNKKGVISRNYKKNNVSYISGEKILSDFGCRALSNSDHTLENIWNALEYRYCNHPNKREIIEKLMNRIVSLFVFDILLCQSDRHSANWEVEESVDNIDIGPVYDNERMLTTSGKSAFLSMLVGEDRSLIDNLQLFIKISSKEFIDILEEKLWIINNNNLKSVFKRVEDRIGCPIPYDVKEYYLKEFNRHRKILKRVLNDNRLGRDDENARKNK